MTTAARTKEAEEASAAFQIALGYIGAKTVEDALNLWQDVPVNMRAATANRWLTQAVRLVLFRRRRSRELALAYYRLVRALRTGTTIASPYERDPATVTLGDLRRQFNALVAETPSEATTPPPRSSTPPDPSEAVSDPQAGDLTPPEPVGGTGDEELIPVETVPGLAEEFERIEKEAEREAQIVLSSLGPKNLAKQNKAVNTKASADEVDTKRTDAHSKAGNRQAAAASRLVKNGARSNVYSMGERDQKVIGWARVSRTGTPCGFCAMLISRGFTPKSGLYRSSRSAGGTAEQIKNGEVDKYHDNCNCYAEPVYSRDDLSSSPLFALNRQYATEWPKVTSGLGGKRALSAWRNYIRRSQKAATQADAA